MIQKLLLIIFTLSLVSCFEDKTEKKPTTAINVGTDFIRATLDGDFKKAEALLYKDSANMQYFEAYKRSYETTSANKKNSYRQASYTINSFTDLNDTTSIIDYSNSYMNQPMKIKLIKINKTWGVDFKYTTGDTTAVK
jgi:hypothetical protein